MDHGVWHQARDAAGRLYFFNDAGETRWDWPGGEAAPLAVQNAPAGALQQPPSPWRQRTHLARAGGEIPRMRATKRARAARGSSRPPPTATRSGTPPRSAAADRAAHATAAAESRRAAADRALSCARCCGRRAAGDGGPAPDRGAWAQAWPAPAPAPPPDDDLSQRSTTTPPPRRRRRLTKRKTTTTTTAWPWTPLSCNRPPGGRAYRVATAPTTTRRRARARAADARAEAPQETGRRRAGAEEAARVPASRRWALARDPPGATAAALGSTGPRRPVVGHAL